jgi:hypothetical protein
MIFQDEETGAWWVTGYVFVADGPNVDCLLGPFEHSAQAIVEADGAKHGILHVDLSTTPVSRMCVRCGGSTREAPDVLCQKCATPAAT